MNETKLTRRQRSLLREAMRRYIHFYSGWELTEAWTGLGYYTTYKSVLSTDLMGTSLMEWVHGKPRFRCAGWLRLTEAGAAIVQAWLDEEATQSKTPVCCLRCTTMATWDVNGYPYCETCGPERAQELLEAENVVSRFHCLAGFTWNSDNILVHITKEVTNEL